MQSLTNKTNRTDAFWQGFVHATGTAGRYDVAAFGDSPEMATDLAELVVGGPKRATAGLLRDFDTGTDPLPVVGGDVVLVDGTGTPRAIWRTTDVRIGSLSSVDDAFAWDEGEGDRTRADWLRMHHAFFAARARREGFVFHDDIETVFERFCLVWPPELADT